MKPSYRKVDITHKEFVEILTNWSRRVLTPEAQAEVMLMASDLYWDHAIRALVVLMATAYDAVNWGEEEFSSSVEEQVLDEYHEYSSVLFTLLFISTECVGFYIEEGCK